MKPPLYLLLPVLSSEDADRFDGLPADALRAAGNLPTLTTSFRPVLCLLAPTALVARLEESPRWAALGRHVELRTVGVDDLVLDHVFEVMPSLAYLAGMAARGDDMVGTPFVFLQPNLVLADGALGNVGRRLASGADIVCGTYLGVDGMRFVHALAGQGRDDAWLSPRSVVRHALACLDIRELANVVNLDLSVSGPVGRVFWQHDRAMLLGYDFLPSLVALRPSRKADQVSGFRDVVFAPALCPGGKEVHLNDSDEFAGVELIDVAAPDVISAPRDTGTLVRELSARTRQQQIGAAVRLPLIFHAGDMPADLGRTRTVAARYVKRLAAALAEAGFANVHDRDWKLGFYLWSVRKFELGRGPLPAMPYELFTRSAAVEASETGSGILAKLISLARAVRMRLFGQLPFVTFMHPDWPDFRRAMPVLRAATRLKRTELLYIGDGGTVLSRVLGAPDLHSPEVLRGAVDATGGGAFDMVIMELSASGVLRWAELVTKVVPAMKRGGRILIFYHGMGTPSGAASHTSLALGWSRLNASRFQGFSMSVMRATGYKAWLRAGYPVGLGYARKRRAPSMIKGAALLAMMSVLTIGLNLSSLFRRSDERPAEACSSATIIIDV